MTPEDAELQYLDNARKLPLYGVDLHQAVVMLISFYENAYSPYCSLYIMELVRRICLSR